MTETVNEPINVIASFSGDRVMPRRFEWRGREYRPTRLGMVHRTREGDAVLLHYGVSDESGGYELIFNTQTLQWRLKSIYIEG